VSVFDPTGSAQKRLREQNIKRLWMQIYLQLPTDDYDAVDEILRCIAQEVTKDRAVAAGVQE
jgi:hypothetical protein